ncbi:hypothetical protein O3M35_004228 [Rhynocoris fuscipes]|uniref:Peptidase C1A papain C-terminal domain-containing protein n=1 Tax=Rhynocoris fuscipes TaxID=488301 RepID=A0AAW1CL39_9HEMI
MRSLLAFSIVSVAETMSALKTGQLQDLSVQEMIDCAGNGNLGCNGGDTCSLIEWLVFNKINIETEKEYPLVLKNEISIGENVCGIAHEVTVFDVV